MTDLREPVEPPSVLWHRLLNRHGPLTTARALPPTAVALAQSAGRVFWIVVTRDGCGSGQVDFVSARPDERLLDLADHLSARRAFVFGDPGFDPRPFLHRLSACGWEDWSDVAGLPADTQTPTLLARCLAAARARPSLPPSGGHELPDAAALARLATAPDAAVRAEAAANPATPMAWLFKLSTDAAPSVRGGVARNPRADSERLERLARDPDADVRASAAANPCAPLNVLVRLAGDASDAVVLAVAENPSSPAPLLTELAGDRSSAVRAAVVRRPHEPAI